MPAPLDSSRSSIHIARAEAAINKGNRGEARRIFAQLTAADPSNERAWLGLAEVAESLEETIAALNQVLVLNRNHTIARRALYIAMHQLLLRDPSLVYRGETNLFYQVQTAADFQFIHPKDREATEPFPPPEWSPSRTGLRWLGWSLIGLIPAGLGTLVCAPFAASAAIRSLRQSPGLADRRRAWFTIWSAVGLWLIALILVSILVLHMI